MARQFGSIRKLPSGRYQARYPAPPDGVSTPAPTTFTTKKGAAAYLADVQSDIERGRWKSREQIAAEEAEVAVSRAQRLTVAGLADVWMETIPSDNHRTLSASRVRRFINPELGDIKVDELTRERCEQWYQAMETRLCPDAPTQRTRTYAALHAMLKLAAHRDLIAMNPLRIKGLLADTPLREPQTVPPDEVDKLAAAMPPSLSMAVQIAAWCGLRMGEVLGLQLGDLGVDPSTPVPLAPVLRIRIRRHVVQGRGTGSMTVVSGSKATGKTESVTVPPHLHQALWEHAESYGRKVEPQWLFPGSRTLDLPCGPATLDRRWRQAREKCDLEQYVFHDLRRTSSTAAALAGATVGELKQRLRHKTSAAAERYIVAAKGADAELAHRISQRVANPHRVLPRVNVIVAGEKMLERQEIDAAIEAVSQLAQHIQATGNENLARYVGERLEEISVELSRVDHPLV